MFRRLICVVLASGLLSAAMADQLADPVAKVNNEQISREQYYQTLVDWFGKQVLEEMIRAAVVEQAASQAGIEISDEQVSSRLEQLKTGVEQRPGLDQEESFQLWLASKRMTIENLRARVRSQMILQEMVEDQVQISSSDVSDYYEKNKQEFYVPTMVKVSVISLRTRQQAQEIRQMISTGETTWGDAASEYSLTRSNVGYRPDDGTPIMKAAMALDEDGEISEIVEFRGLYHIVKREDKKTERVRPFEEVKDAIENRLRQQQMLKLMDEKRDELLEKADVKRLVSFGDATAQ